MPGSEDGPTRVRGTYGSFDARSLGAQDSWPQSQTRKACLMQHLTIARRPATFRPDRQDTAAD